MYVYNQRDITVCPMRLYYWHNSSKVALYCDGYLLIYRLRMGFCVTLWSYIDYWWVTLGSINNIAFSNINSLGPTLSYHMGTTKPMLKGAGEVPFCAFLVALATARFYRYIMTTVQGSRGQCEVANFAWALLIYLPKHITYPNPLK